MSPLGWCHPGRSAPPPSDAIGKDKQVSNKFRIIFPPQLKHVVPLRRLSVDYMLRQCNAFCRLEKARRELPGSGQCIGVCRADGCGKSRYEKLDCVLSRRRRNILAVAPQILQSFLQAVAPYAYPRTAFVDGVRAGLQPRLLCPSPWVGLFSGSL